MADVVGEVMRHLPHPRRHACGVAGDRGQGDAHVRACLEALPPGIAELGARDPKLLLHRTLHRVWSDDAAARDRQAPSPQDRTIMTLRLRALGLSRRRILLLTALEGFALAEAAAAMGLPAADALLRQAKAALRAQPASRVLIIEEFDAGTLRVSIAQALCAGGRAAA